MIEPKDVTKLKEEFLMHFTVKELIEELQCYEENTIVWLSIDRMEAPVRIVKLDVEDEKIILK